MNDKILVLQTFWVPAEFGGRTNAPVPGLRPALRLQRDVGQWLVSTWSVYFVEVIGREPVGAFTISAAAPADAKFSSTLPLVGEFIELMDGPRVIAVGRIESARDSTA